MKADFCIADDPVPAGELSDEALLVEWFLEFYDKPRSREGVVVSGTQVWHEEDLFREIMQQEKRHGQS